MPYNKSIQAAPNTPLVLAVQFRADVLGEFSDLKARLMLSR